MSALEKFIDEDFGLHYSGDRWGRSKKHSSLVYDRERDRFYFNAQGINGDAITYLMRVRGLSLGSAKEYLKSLGEVYEFPASNEEKQSVVLPDLVDIFWEGGKKNRDYWYTRLLTDETIDDYKLGYCDGWFTIPIFVDDVFRNFQFRRDYPNRQVFSWYSGVGPLPFNFDILKLTNRVFITEGIVDCILLNQLGIPSVSKNLGASVWMDSWFKYFINQKQIYYIGDNDTAGRKGAEIVANKLGMYRTKVFIFEGRREKYDTVNYFQDGGNKKEYLGLVYGESKYVFEM